MTTYSRHSIIDASLQDNLLSRVIIGSTSALTHSRQGLCQSENLSPDFTL
jgi:hypothetical protein